MNSAKRSYFSVQRKAVLVLVAAGVFFLTGAVAQAASIHLSPSSGSHAVGQTFTATVIVNSGSAGQLNAVEAELGFDTNVLTVTNVSQANSVLSLWTQEPTYSNSAGTISFGGGNPSPFSGSSTIMSVTFRVQSEGSGTVSFNSASATAADGTGRDVLSSTSPATYTGTSAPEPEPEPEPTPEPTPEPSPSPSAPTPGAPDVESETHPEDNPWHNEFEANFSWDLPSGITAVRLLVNRESEATPSVVYEPPIDSRELDNDLFDGEEGEWFFHIQFRNNAGWGSVTSYAFSFDMVAPEDFDIEVLSEEGDPRPHLSFHTTDEHSGVREYEINVADMDPLLISADDHEAADNEYIFGVDLPAGDHVLEVIARDRAGNVTASQTEITVEERERAVPDTDEDEDKEGFFARFGMMLLILFLLAIIGGLGGYIWWMRDKARKDRAHARREVHEIRTEMERIFAALMEESEEIFASFDGKKGLSAKEKKAYQKIKNAIEISEELIGKEIDDVDKLLSK